MAFTHKPLTEAEAGPGAWKAIGPNAAGPMKGMAARGLAPLPPRDLLVALYQFWVTNEDNLGDESAKTAVGLPDGVLFGALDDPTLPPGPLDFVGRKFPRNEGVLLRVVRHPNVDDETLAGLGRICPESICDVIADNQQRWMQFPTIVESLYQNPNCRMSVAHRMLELAVRQGIEVRLPNMEEIKAALGESAAPSESDDAQFKGAMGRDIADGYQRVVEQVQRGGASEEPDYTVPLESDSDEIDIDALLSAAPLDDLSLPLEGDQPAQPPAGEEASAEPAVKGDRMTEIARLPAMQKMRLALLGGAYERSVLIRDTNKSVCMSAIKSPRVKENEVVAYSANRTLSHDVIRYIARRRDWMKLYQVKYNLVVNPKTPLSAAMGFLGHLHAHDIKKVARSRNIPSALAQAAKRKEAKRR